jgi:peptide/nickel transport system permease protein
MGAFIVRRLLMSVIVLFGVTVIVSAMLLISGDPVAVMLAEGRHTVEERAALRRELGLDKPFPVMYVEFVSGLLRGDLGRSLRFHQPAAPLVMERLPATLQLAVGAMAFAVAVAVPVGVISAARPRSVVDYAGRALTLIGQSVPLFWLGIMLVMVFAVRLRWLPAGGRLAPTSIILPAITLGLLPMARIARTLRASMLETLRMDYCRTARSKGATMLTVVAGHALRNALLPVVTVIGLQFGALLGGAVVTETIFAWPGLGWLSVQAIGARDVPLMRAIVALIALVFILINLCTDVAYAYLDPRIRYT